MEGRMGMEEGGWGIRGSGGRRKPLWAPEKTEGMPALDMIPACPPTCGHLGIATTSRRRQGSKEDLSLLSTPPRRV